MDQFTYAERATDWRGNNNIAETIFAQMRQERHPVPGWVVMGAGTGGTSATIGRYIRYRRYATRLCVVDAEHSVFFDGLPIAATRHCTLRSRLAHRGHRPAAGRAVVRSRRRRSHDAGAGRGLARRDAGAVAAAGPARRRLDRHQLLGLCWLVAEMRRAARQARW